MPSEKGLGEQTGGAVLATPPFYLQKGLQTRRTSGSSPADEGKWASSVRTQGDSCVWLGWGWEPYNTARTPLLGFAHLC